MMDNAVIQDSVAFKGMQVGNLKVLCNNYYLNSNPETNCIYVFLNEMDKI